MSALDFQDVIFDEDLAETFSVIHRNEVVGEDGRSMLSTTRTDGVVGVVTPGDPGNILRRDDNQMTTRVITITTMFRMRPAAEGIQPDQVFYDATTFTVKALKAWNRMGSGFFKVVAESELASSVVPV